MPLKKISVTTEEVFGSGARGEYYLSDIVDCADNLLEKYRGKAKCVYLDPPFMTGQKFFAKVRVGADDWKKSSGSMKAESFSDCMSKDEYYQMMRTAIELSKDLLSDEGGLFLHVDYRANARLRLICDEIFGEDNFVNEIIWAYKSGGRSKSSFPKKHDVILFYQKSDRLDFDIDRVLVTRDNPPDNHMRKHVDPDGRVYRSIRSGDKVYTYYDDAPSAPTDVWDDVSHLQQRDYERTGYDTQKPLKLLHRIERSITNEGDIVMDFFSGACTSLEAAKVDGRRFVGVDKCPLTLNIARRRLSGAGVTYHYPESELSPECSADFSIGVGMYYVNLTGFDFETCGYSGFETIDNWSAGYIESGVFKAFSSFERTRSHPDIQKELSVPVFSGEPAIRIGDILGNNYFYMLDKPIVPVQS